MEYGWNMDGVVTIFHPLFFGSLRLQLFSGKVPEQAYHTKRAKNNNVFWLVSRLDRGSR
jgi:hypothetical protein